MIGQFDDILAQNFGNLEPLPEGYAVIWLEANEKFYATKRGTDLEIGPTWNRYWCRKWCFNHYYNTGSPDRVRQALKNCG